MADSKDTKNETPDKSTNGDANKLATQLESTTLEKQKPINPEDEQRTDSASADNSYLQKLLRQRLVEDTADTEIEVERKNPDSPLYSVKSFEELNLNKDLLKGLYGMGFTKPSKIQETALPNLLSNPPQNLIAQSQSGTGKTAAFVLTMLSRIDTSLNYPQALCLAPTMELAIQIANVVSQMGRYMPNLKVALAIKGIKVERNIKLSDHIIIGTPGTMFDWSSPRLKVVDLKKIKVFCLDEADVMIDQQGHQDMCIRIVMGLDKSCQMMLFSATYKPPVIEFATKIVKEPIIIRLRKQEESLSYIKQYFIECPDQNFKYAAVVNIFSLLTIGQAIIFCHTKKTASSLVARLMEDGVKCELLSGDLDVNQRVDVIQRFREGKAKMLITTNVTARGIDIDDVKLVINYDLPVDMQGYPDYETYLHRIGRTGRFGKHGIAINLVDSRSMPILEKIQKHFSRTIERLDANDPDQIVKLDSNK